MGQAYLFGHENKTSKNLRDSVVMKPSQDYRSSLAIEVLYEFHPDRLFACHSMC